MGGMTQFAGQEKVGGAWASEVAKCMQYPLTQNKLYFALNCAIMIDMFSSIFYQNSKPLVFLSNVYAYI